MNKYKLLPLLLLGITLSYSSCSKDIDENEPFTPKAVVGPTMTISSIVNSDSRTDSLEKALSLADLATAFKGSGTFTLFAPTNQAFMNLLASDSTWNKIADINNATLRNVLLYHTLASVVNTTTLTDDSYESTLNTQGTSNGEATVIEFDISGGNKLNNRSTIIEEDIEATNGIIQLIDEVVMPKNIYELAMNEERFSSLVSAIQVIGDTLSNVISGNGQFTFFAPTNEAFQSLLNSDSSWNSVSDIPMPRLDSILRYHLIGGANYQSSQLRSGQVISTLGGGTLMVDTISNQLISNNMNQTAVKMIITDLQGTNGVIHAVEQVLLP